MNTYQMIRDGYSPACCSKDTVLFDVKSVQHFGVSIGVGLYKRSVIIPPPIYTRTPSASRDLATLQGNVRRCQAKLGETSRTHGGDCAAANGRQAH
ncbi:hypothetical protein Trydic_g9881 [Trypoxylus dichotomus]